MPSTSHAPLSVRGVAPSLLRPEIAVWSSSLIFDQWAGDEVSGVRRCGHNPPCRVNLFQRPAHGPEGARSCRWAGPDKRRTVPTDGAGPRAAESAPRGVHCCPAWRVGF